MTQHLPWGVKEYIIFAHYSFCLYIVPYTEVNSVNEATLPLATFIYAIIGVAVTMAIVGFAMSLVTGLACRKQQPTILPVPNITRSEAPSSSSVDGEVGAGVIAEYEEISLHEAKDIHLTDNAAYVCKPSCV